MFVDLWKMGVYVMRKREEEVEICGIEYSTYCGKEASSKQQYYYVSKYLDGYYSFSCYSAMLFLLLLLLLL